MTQLAEFQRFLRASIPLAAATGMQLTGYDGRKMTISAPLQHNTNHHGTAFGGSLYVVALAAAWGLVHLLATDAGFAPATYVRHAEADYRLPVTTDLRACARLDASNAKQQFLQGLEQQGRGRINVLATIGDTARPAFLLEAAFTAVRPGDN